MTAVEWLVKETPNIHWEDGYWADLFERAKQREKQDMENKAIHFAEWLTNKHTLTLMHLYEQFDEQFYTDERRS